jgi:hypothetical protein
LRVVAHAELLLCFFARYTCGVLDSNATEPAGISLDMMRPILRAIWLVLFVTNAQAAGMTDLKAANSAAEKGFGDEAIQLFTQALATGDLSVEDQFIARKGRAREYSAKSLIADTFDRHDDGRRLRDNAIADFSAALSLKANDGSVLIERGQDYHMSQQFDLAVADFSAALNLNNSPSILLQRAASQRARAHMKKRSLTAPLRLPSNPGTQASRFGISTTSAVTRNFWLHVMMMPPRISTKRFRSGQARTPTMCYGCLTSWPGYTFPTRGPAGMMLKNSKVFPARSVQLNGRDR